MMLTKLEKPFFAQERAFEMRLWPLSMLESSALCHKGQYDCPVQTLAKDFFWDVLATSMEVTSGKKAPASLPHVPMQRAR